jgi:hypothetical protein
MATGHLQLCTPFIRYLTCVHVPGVQAQQQSKTFHRRLVWRDLAYWQLHHWQRMATEPIREHYIDLEWNWGPEARQLLRAWQRGLTGFPLVDAGGCWGSVLLLLQPYIAILLLLQPYIAIYKAHWHSLPLTR